MRRAIIIVLAATMALLGAPAASAQEFQIVNGQPADPGEYPAQVAILQAQQQFQFCGGTLIDPMWVMTAAHCFYDDRTGGTTFEPGDIELVLNAPNWTNSGERVRIDAIVLHPEYDPFALTNDITLLRLTAPAQTPPARLPAADQQALYQPPRSVTATGYGTTSEGGNASTDLLEVDLPMVSDTECASFYGPLPPDRHVCAGGTGQPGVPNSGGDSCQGDSGGPLWTDPGDGILTVIGVTSFGNGCGRADPGVYTEVITYLNWMSSTINGDTPINTPDDPTTPDLPDGSGNAPVRVTYDESGVSDPVLQAVAMSRRAFPNDPALFGVIATSNRFPDALGGSSLAYGVAPLLFTNADGTLSQETTTELRRAVVAGGEIFVLGGEAVIPATTDQVLRDLGFTVTRLAGAGRESTAVTVANKIVERFGELPLDTVVVATGSNWPDAVTVGQVGSWWGTPILLTPTGGALNPDTGAFLQAHQPSRVLVPGGTAAVTDQTVAAIEAITGPGSVVRLAGATRFGTGAAITSYNVQNLYSSFAPDMIVAVNLRREPDAFAHVLAASMLTGAFAGVMVPVEGDLGDTVTQEALDSVCGLNARTLAAGATDLISDAVIASINGASGGTGCDATGRLDVGDSVESSITEALPERRYQFDGVTGQLLQIRMDAPGFGQQTLDPYLRLFGPDGQLVAENDDNPTGEPGFNSLLLVELPADGTYTIEASRFGTTTGPFKLSLDPLPSATAEGFLSADTPFECYPVFGAPGIPVIVEMRALDFAIDPLLVAFDGDTDIASDDDGGGFPNSRMSFPMPASGSADVCATVYADFFGEYRILVIDPTGGISYGSAFAAQPPSGRSMPGRS